ncbi:MAG TPA: DUF3047 domain-containing protein, partial [Polyangiaceae bacterium]|nr:DUF3047 domain-containing protein [Polyangiaceae bacterium]
LTQAASAAPAGAPSKVVCDRVLENFSSSKVGAFPQGWRAKDASQMPAATQNGRFVVEQEGARKVLHVTHRDQALTIGKAFEGWDLKQYPVLQFQWKAVKLPTGGNEDSTSHNDCGAAVYGFWDIGFPFSVNSIKYTWSSTLKVGTEISKRLGHDFVRVVQSGNAGAGQWHTVRVDVRADYLRLFKTAEAAAPRGIAILTDADATNSEAEAYYADFRLCRPA